MFEHIQKLPYSWHIKNQTGDIIQRSTSDVEVVRNFISTQLVEIFRVIMLVIISLILMFSMNFHLTVSVLIFIPVVVLYSTIFYGILTTKFLVADEAEGKLFTAIQENLTGVRVVRAFGREKHEIDKFTERNNTFSELWVKLGYQLGYYWGIGDLVTGVLLKMCIRDSYEGINNIKTINDNAGIKPVKVDKRIIDLIKFSKDMYEKTNGKTNIAFGAVLSIWHEYRTIGIEDPANAALPSEEELRIASEHTNIEDIVIDEEHSTVFLSDPLMRLDVGAVAKGYATEQVSNCLLYTSFNPSTGQLQY